MPSYQLFSKSIHTLLICIAFFSCKPDSERTAIDLISKSIEAHGGSEAWESVESLIFMKDTKLYLADSSIENHLIQEIEVRFKPKWEIKMNWQKDSVSHRSVFDGNTTRYWLGENEIQNQDFLKSKRRDLDAAAYVMTKPFDLLTGDKQIEYTGLVLLPDGKEYQSVRVVDGPHSGSNADIWVYYFNPRDGKLTAYSVKTLDHISLVFNDGWAVFGGLILPLRRKSYRLLESGEIEYLRAEYEFSEYRLNK